MLAGLRLGLQVTHRVKAAWNNPTGWKELLCYSSTKHEVITSDNSSAKEREKLPSGSPNYHGVGRTSSLKSMGRSCLKRRKTKRW